MRAKAMPFVLILLASFPAYAKQLPPELANSSKDLQFIIMPPLPDGSCNVGVKKPGGNAGPTHCDVSINECLALPNARITRATSGNWHCRHR